MGILASLVSDPVLAPPSAKGKSALLKPKPCFYLY